MTHDDVRNFNPPADCLKGKNILVTGAGDGIGKVAALTYAKYGATVLLLGKTASKLEEVYDEIEANGGAEPAMLPMNLESASYTEMQQLAILVEREVGHIDGILHNAGMLGVLTPLEMYDPIIFEQVMKVNFNATFMLTQALLPLLLKSESGSLVFTSSSVGREGRANWGAYAVSKFATEGMMQVLAEEYQSRHLRVNCINPGGTRTKMRANAFPTEDPQKLKTPADIMPLYLWLMGDDSRRKTGMTFDAQPGRKPGISQ